MKWRRRAAVLALFVSTVGIQLTAQEAAHLGQAAKPTEDSWLKDPITNCSVWGSDLRGDNLISWSGDCHDGKATGTGVLSWIHDGKLAGRYSGPMVDGKAQGLGTIDFWLDNQYLHYEGSFLNSKLDGWGSVRWPDGGHLEGEFKDDAPSGLVRYTAANGSSYAGEVKNELADGQGHQILPDKEEYYGQFRQGKREGEGVLLLPNGDIFTGSFRNDQPSGTGKLQLASGIVYEGPFVNGLCTFNHSNAAADCSAPGCPRSAADKRTQHCSG